ncbi:methyl-accepting chemotaxis protein [Rhodoferax sp. U11-2br]|uniref:methyl-accepting chemotaxis protein n=1 Tax=Rhodoferax sp. U11-2br TaxID=2838878 RepID=UPI00203732D5|nr:methyl-accepting chemotaxis protein [Rhodoferax sp. U11-2br]
MIAMAIASLIGLWSAARLTTLSERVFVSKDVVADILPPPMYLIEMRLVVSRVFEKTLTPAAAALEVERLAKEYNARVVYWTSNPPYGLEKQLLGAQHATAQQFIAAVKAVVAKAGARGLDEFQSELLQLEELYEKHRAGVDATVAESTKFAAIESDSFTRVVSQSRWWLLMTLVVTVTVVVVLFTVTILSITRPLSSTVHEIRKLAEGDMSVAVPPGAADEIGAISSALSGMQSNWVQIVAKVRRGSESLATASAEIAQGNSDLSARTESQASALEQTATSLEELSATVKQNAASAREANQLALSASSVAGKGGAVVAQVVETMKGINESSKKIGDITSVIDSIAFQTNILALNAAVEAARAGEQGRGFAVVASEVRSLAGRSAEAAKEIKNLINASVERVDLGSALADQAGVTMSEVVSAIRRVTDIMGEISSASSEQAAGVAQVGAAVSQMDQATQQNASLVEQMAAAASSLKAQAQELVLMVAVFKLGGDQKYHPVA